MAAPDKTIFQLEAEEYHGIMCRCLNPQCRNCVVYPFRLIRMRHPHLMLSAMTIAELGRSMPCGKCGNRDHVSYSPSRQSDGPGYAKGF